MVVSANIYSYELGFISQIGNLTLGNQSTTSNTQFDGSKLFYGGSAYAILPVYDDVTFTGGLFYDPILRYAVKTIFEYQKNFLKFSFGPYMGSFNSLNYPLKPGLHTGFRVDLPGYVFASLSSDTSIGSNFVDEGDYSQSLSDLRLGFYVKNAICSFQLETKEYLSEASKGMIKNSRTRYAFLTDIYKKNVPYRILITMAYQDLTTIYQYSDQVEIKIGSIILGSRLEFQVNNKLNIIGSVDTSVYNFPLNGTSTTKIDTNKFIYDALLGIKIKME